MARAHRHAFQIRTKGGRVHGDPVQRQARPCRTAATVWLRVSVENRRHGLFQVEHLRSARASPCSFSPSSRSWRTWARWTSRASAGSSSAGRAARAHGRCTRSGCAACATSVGWRPCPSFSSSVGRGAKGECRPAARRRKPAMGFPFRLG